MGYMVFLVTVCLMVGGCIYAYMKMARNVGIEVPDFDLLEAGNGRFWLQQTRFDFATT
ncbi:HipA domain-containing protein [Xenorhabdus griffiniae]|uniref:HipA domain-containing protein n=1 Tax=Xenorhabdus griffiniae TaxID=351672 RepID=A0ABY9XNW7_9GAMM|nr:HipA domain-containing protein [Xenorhabdus griffiniae]WMV74577.1 HipA domain-containing protein [Xenorhabdus griffiniae]WNH04256.1 HipA domain-containing protein [Xenorhabdus griffiniae]